jgi:RNA polymerase sigma factor (TIGR02999 family)
MSEGEARSGGEAPERSSSDAFFAQVYEELKAIAHARMMDERTGHTLQSTELVHEAFLRMRPDEGGEWRSRGQFFAAAALAMRRILVEHARARGRVKRGGDSEGKPAAKVTLELEGAAVLADSGDPETILALDEAIEKLGRQDARAAQVVRLRFYGGLSVEEVAGTLETSERTILRDWAFARAWLYDELSKG